MPDELETKITSDQFPGSNRSSNKTETTLSRHEERLDDYNKDLRGVQQLMIGVTIGVAIAFVTTVSLLLFDLIKEKDLYSKYNDLYQKYSDKNFEVQYQIELLRARNSYLK